MTDYEPGDPVELSPGILVQALSADLEHEELPPGQVVDGSPTTAAHVLDERDGHELGIWEMTPGTATDVEVDEICIVLSGRATVRFDETAGSDAVAGTEVELGPGAVLRFTEGMHTTWTVHETLRKIYLT